MPKPDFPMILGAFADARAVFIVAIEALEASERYPAAASVLRIGLNIHDAAYSDLDAATRERT